MPSRLYFLSNPCIIVWFLRRRSAREEEDFGGDRAGGKPAAPDQEAIEVSAAISGQSLAFFFFRSLCITVDVVTSALACQFC